MNSSGTASYFLFFAALLHTMLAALAPPPAAALDPRLAAVKDYGYLLQVGTTSVPALAAKPWDLLILDYSRDGDDATRLTPVEIKQLRDSGKVVLAYLSVGEAEDYRSYWQPAWTTSPPAWLGPTNPDWAGNYKVRYWDPGWHSILYGTASGPTQSYLDKIIDQGFDGIYLDIIDAYEYWSTADGGNERTRTQARQDMLALVTALRTYARTTRAKPDFLIFPQNASDIIYDDNGTTDSIGANWLSVVDGIGNEDVWYDATTLKPAAEATYVVEVLRHYKSASDGGRLVLVVDYVWNPAQATTTANKNRYNNFKSLAAAEGFISYAAPRNRELDTLLEVSAGNGLNYTQPLSAESPTPTPPATDTPAPTLTPDPTPTAAPTTSPAPSPTPEPTALAASSAWALF